MATPVKVGARNDLFALKEARRFTSEATTQTERALDEMARMREQSGRPDYGHMAQVLGHLALSLSKSTTALEEMWVIRAQARQDDEDEQLFARIARLESQINQMEARIGRVTQ